MIYKGMNSKEEEWYAYDSYKIFLQERERNSDANKSDVNDQPEGRECHRLIVLMTPIFFFFCLFLDSDSLPWDFAVILNRGKSIFPPLDSEFSL